MKKRTVLAGNMFLKKDEHKSQIEKKTRLNSEILKSSNQIPKQTGQSCSLNPGGEGRAKKWLDLS